MAITQRTLRRILDPIRRKIRLTISRAIVTLVDDSGGFQILQVKGLPGEVLDGIERFQEYGFTSVPLPGAEAILVFVGGSRSHGVAIAVDDRRHRKKGMQRGESAIHTDEGDSIHLKRGKIIAVTSGGEIQVTAPKIKLAGAIDVDIAGLLVKISATGAIVIDATGAVTIDGATIGLTGTTTIEGRLWLAHTHSGVFPGGGNTGGVN